MGIPAGAFNVSYRLTTDTSSQRARDLDNNIDLSQLVASVAEILAERARAPKKKYKPLFVQIIKCDIAAPAAPKSKKVCACLQSMHSSSHQRFLLIRLSRRLEKLSFPIHKFEERKWVVNRFSRQVPYFHDSGCVLFKLRFNIPKVEMGGTKKNHASTCLFGV
jgi:hypothetical protein